MQKKKVMVVYNFNKLNKLKKRFEYWNRKNNMIE